MCVSDTGAIQLRVIYTNNVIDRNQDNLAGKAMRFHQVEYTSDNAALARKPLVGINGDVRMRTIVHPVADVRGIGSQVEPTPVTRNLEVFFAVSIQVTLQSAAQRVIFDADLSRIENNIDLLGWHAGVINNIGAFHVITDDIAVIISNRQGRNLPFHKLLKVRPGKGLHLAAVFFRVRTGFAYRRRPAVPGQGDHRFTHWPKAASRGRRRSSERLVPEYLGKKGAGFDRGIHGHHRIHHRRQGFGCAVLLDCVIFSNSFAIRITGTGPLGASHCAGIRRRLSCTPIGHDRAPIQDQGHHASDDKYH